MAYVPKCQIFSTIQSYAPNLEFRWFPPQNEVQFAGGNVDILKPYFIYSFAYVNHLVIVSTYPA
jgi:hypothetical protein